MTNIIYSVGILARGINVPSDHLKILCQQLKLDIVLNIFSLHQTLTFTLAMAFASNNNRVHLAPLWHLPITCVRIMIDRIQIDQSSSEDYISIYLVNECGSCIRTTISRDEHDLQGRVEYEALNTETCAARVNSIDLIVDDGQPQISAKFVRDLIEREQFNFYSYSPAGCGTQYWV